MYDMDNLTDKEKRQAYNYLQDLAELIFDTTIMNKVNYTLVETLIIALNRNNIRIDTNRKAAVFGALTQILRNDMRKFLGELSIQGGKKPLDVLAKANEGQIVPLGLIFSKLLLEQDIGIIPEKPDPEQAGLKVDKDLLIDPNTNIHKVLLIDKKALLNKARSLEKEIKEGKNIISDNLFDKLNFNVNETFYLTFAVLGQ